MKYIIRDTLLVVILATSMFSSMAVFATVYAAGTPSNNLSYTPLEPIKGVDDQGTNAYDLPTLLNGLFKVLITLCALFAVGTFVYGGITYMMSDIVGNKEKARDRMRASLWGLVLVIASVLILNTINPQILNFSLFNQDTGPTQKTGN